jgi:hypothetical protein
MFLSGVVLTLAAAWITATHDAVPRSEINEIVRGIYQQMNEQNKANGERSTRMETDIHQMALDITRISEHLGVPAHPAAAH